MKKHTDLLGFEQINIGGLLKEASCRQKSQELADSYSLEELQSRLEQIMMDMEQEAEPEGGPIADMYADEMDTYEQAIKLAKNPFEKDSVGGMTYDDMLKKHYPSKDEFTKSSEFDKNKWEDDFDKKYPSLGEGKWIGDNSYKTRTAVNTAPGVTEDKEITIDNAKSLDNVTIRWRGANHWGNKTLTNLEFAPEFADGVGESLLAISNDSKWTFIVDIDEETGEADWDTLIIDSRELEQDDGSYAVPPEDMVEQGLMESPTVINKLQKIYNKIKGWLSGRIDPNDPLFQQLVGDLNEQGFDDRLAQQMGMSDDEFEDQVASRDIGDPFLDDDDYITPGAELASRTIEKLRQQYRGMSDQDMDDFSKEMIEHFLDNTTAQAAAKIWFGKRNI